MIAYVYCGVQSSSMSPSEMDGVQPIPGSIIDQRLRAAMRKYGLSTDIAVDDDGADDDADAGDDSDAASN